MRIIFLRHGKTNVNVEGKTHVTGDTSELTDDGISQISKAVSVLKKNNVKRIYCSPEKRALQSAELASQKLNVSLEILDSLRERNWGDWEGKPWNEIKEVLDKFDLEERYNFIPPNGESWKQMESRLNEALTKITNGEENCVCVVTHMGSLRGLIPILKNQQKEVSLKYDFENGSITIFDFENNKFNEVVVNDTSHLQATES